MHNYDITNTLYQYIKKTKVEVETPDLTHEDSGVLRRLGISRKDREHFFKYRDKRHETNTVPGTKRILLFEVLER